MIVPPVPLSQIPQLRPSAAPPLKLLQLLQEALLQVHVVPPLGMLPTVQVPASELDPELELDDPELELPPEAEPEPELEAEGPELEPELEPDEPWPELEELAREPDPELEAAPDEELAAEAAPGLDPSAPDSELDEPWPELDPPPASTAPPGHTVLSDVHDASRAKSAGGTRCKRTLMANRPARSAG